MTWIAQEWDSLRGRHFRGEIGEDAYLRRCGELSDSLGVSREARELGYRIDLLRCLEGLEGPEGARSDGWETHDVLPRLWEMHRESPERFPGNPDAPGGADGQDGPAGPDGPDGTEGTDLPNVFDLLWQEAVLCAAQRPDIDRATVEDLCQRALDALSELGRSDHEIADAKVRVLLALGEVEDARALLDTLPEPHLPDDTTWADAHRYQRELDVRGMVALQAGDLDAAAEIVAEMEQSPEAHMQPTVMLAESLIPLAATVPPEVTAARAAFVADRAVGVPELSEAMLQVAEYLAVTGREAHALGLVDRTMPVLGLERRNPASDVHLLEGLHTVFSAAKDAGYGAVRPLFAGMPAVADWLALAGENAGGGTVAGLARWTGERARTAAAALDLRNGNDLESTVGLGLHRLPAGAAAVGSADPAAESQALAVTPAIPQDLPSWVDSAWLTLPREAADWDGAVSATPSPEVPVAGPVDLAALDTDDAVAALMLYSMLGLEDAVGAAIDRLGQIRESRTGLGVHQPMVEALLRRYEVFGEDEAGDETGDDAGDEPDDPVLDQLDELMRDRQRAQEEGESAGAEPRAILANRVDTVASYWRSSEPMVRRVIEQDVLMGGVYPDLESLRLALRAVKPVTRLAPRSIPEVGSALLAGIVQLAAADPAVDALVAQVAHYVAGVALSLPMPPPGPTLMLGEETAPELLDELLSLGVTLSGHGAFHEALAVYDRCLEIVTDDGDTDDGDTQDAADDDSADAVLMRVHLFAARGETLAKLGNHWAASGTFSDAADSARYHGHWEAAAEYQVTCVSCLLDDSEFPRAAVVLETLDNIEGLDWMRFPHATFRREVQATRLASALVGENFAEEWPQQVNRLTRAYDTFRTAALAAGGDGGHPSAEELGLRAAGDLVDHVLVINRGLVHTGRLDEALELTAWAAGTARDAEEAFDRSGASGTPGAVTAARRPEPSSARLEALTEEALLLHVAGHNDQALLIFESVVQQARRLDADWLVDGVVRRVEAAASHSGDRGVRERYTDLLRELTGDGPVSRR